MLSIEAYWKLDKNPFLNNLDQDFLYPSTDFNESLARLIFNIVQIKGGLSLITGEIGSGKTTLSRALFDRMVKSNAHVALIANPRLSPTQLLRLIALEFGIEKPGRTKLQIIDKINTMLIEHYRQKKLAVLIIDEAQLMTKAALEEVRLLTNLETSQEKLLQITILGQPELNAKIKRLPQLKQRINIRYHIGAFSREEMEEYIQHRLQIAHSRTGKIFPTETLDKIYEYSGGIPRVVNTICLNALLGGMMHRESTISPELVGDVIAELEGEI